MIKCTLNSYKCYYRCYEACCQALHIQGGLKERERKSLCLHIPSTPHPITKTLPMCWITNCHVFEYHTVKDALGPVVRVNLKNKSL